MPFAKGQTGYWLGKKRLEMIGNKYAQGHIPWNKGLPPLNPFKKGNKLGSLHKGIPSGRKGIKLSEEHKQKISLALKDKPKSIEHREHKTKVPVIIQCATCGKKFNVPPCHGKGRKKYCSYECRNLSKIAEKCHFWEGGISFKPYPLGWNKTFKEQIRYRDGYKCKICGMPELENGRKLDVHHKDYDKENIDVGNLVSLCRRCHVKTNGNRKYWEKKLNENII